MYVYLFYFITDKIYDWLIYGHEYANQNYKIQAFTYYF